MKVKIAKWGNSLAIRLPKRYADDLGLKLGSTVEVERDGTRLAIETVPEHKIPRYPLEDLLVQIKPGQVPSHEDWGILPTEWPAEDWSDIAPSDAEWEAWKREAEEQPTPNEAAKAEDRGAIPPRRRA